MNKVYWYEVPGYQKFYSEVSYKLAIWAAEEENRGKAITIKRIADRIEDRKRGSINTKNHTPLDIDLYFLTAALKKQGGNL